MRRHVPLDYFTEATREELERVYGIYDHQEPYTHITAQALLIWLKENLKMPNLFPDMEKKQYDGSEDFIFGAPIHQDVWKKIGELSKLTPDGVPYFQLPKEVTNTDFNVTVLLQHGDRNDDDMLDAAAWLRMVENCRDRIYAVPWYRTMDLPTQLNKTIGAPRRLSIMFDLPKEKEDAK